ncbi:MAG: hypothetical protein OXC11_13930, partial [Rhodospirillales bacterium]|nr:hypothetical protein [Rhodospirillales bacterium]
AAMREVIVGEHARRTASVSGRNVGATKASERHRQVGGEDGDPAVFGGGGPGVVDEEDRQRNERDGQQEERGAAEG